MATVGFLLLSIHLAVTAAMVGLIWFVPVVHHPLLSAVGSERFEECAAAHQRQTSFVAVSS